MTPWPYPGWIAHRGAGKLAPENTLAAFKLGAARGYRMFECDVKLSADGVPFLLHDATLERTTNGHGVAGELPWEALAVLDAGSWHSSRFAGEALPSLEAIARYCIHNHYFLNIEIKPTPGLESRTGSVIANEAARLWQGVATPPLLSSFQPACLAAALHAQPQLPRGLLLGELQDGWLDLAAQLQCVAIVCNYKLWNPDTVAQAQQAGFKKLCYTANDEVVTQRLIAMGVDGIITDSVDQLKPD